MISLRCSALPRVSLCSASAIPPKVKIDTPSEAASLGTAVHEVLAARVANKDVDLGEVAAKYEVDLPELAKLVSIAWAGWQRVAPHFTNPVSEVKLGPIVHDPEEPMIAMLDEGVTLDGTADLIDNDGDVVYGLDWKTGWADADAEQQVRGYGMLALEASPWADKVVWIVFKLRLGVIDTYEWTRAELAEWWAGLASKVSRNLDVFSPSLDACRYCPRWHECPAREAMMRQALALVDDANAHFQANENEALATLTYQPGKMADVLQAARAFKALCEQVETTIKAAVHQAGGSIPLPDGRELAINATVQTKIDFAAGEGVLMARCGDRYREAVTVSKTKAVEIVRSLAVGKKKDAEEAFLAELDQAEALKLTVVEKLELRKAPKAVASR